jgi:hypothetical protein
MGYKVLVDGTTVLKVSATHESGQVEHVSVQYREGDVIPDEDVAPVVQEAYEAGDERTLKLLEKEGSSKSSSKEESSSKSRSKGD